MFSTLILDLCVLPSRRQLASPPSRSTFFSMHGVAGGFISTVSLMGRPPALHLRLQNGRRAARRRCGERGAWVLWGVRLPYLPPIGRSLPLSHFPTAISIYTRAGFPRPDRIPSPFPSRARSSSPIPVFHGQRQSPSH